MPFALMLELHPRLALTVSCGNPLHARDSSGESCCAASARHFIPESQLRPCLGSFGSPLLLRCAIHGRGKRDVSVCGVGVRASAGSRSLCDGRGRRALFTMADFRTRMKWCGAIFSSRCARVSRNRCALRPSNGRSAGAFRNCNWDVNWRVGVLSEEQTPQVIVFSGKLSEKAERLGGRLPSRAVELSFGRCPGCIVENMGVASVRAARRELVKLFRKPNSKFYRYDFTVRGRRYRGSTQETTSAGAAKAASLKLRL